jgi:hypothetical protein
LTFAVRAFHCRTVHAEAITCDHSAFLAPDNDGAMRSDKN